MPHVIVKMYPGRSEQQKARLAEEITKAVIACANSKEADVSVSIEEVASAEWAETVYKPEILAHPERLYKKPGYTPS